MDAADAAVKGATWLQLHLRSDYDGDLFANVSC